MNVQILKSKAKARYDVTYCRELNIQKYDKDNLYPQYLRFLVQSSPTASGCVERYASFIEGNGIADINVAEYTVNRRGETFDELHRHISDDFALYGGFCLHVNYNIFGDICELNWIPFENARLLEQDDNGYVAEICLHPDWMGKLSRSGNTVQVNKKNADFLPVFNPRKEVVLSQIDAVGGIDYYRGQVLYYGNNGYNRYPVSRADRIATEMSIDEGLTNVKFRNVRNNFLPAGMVITKKGQEAPYNDNGDENYYEDGFSDTLEALQGDTNCGKLIEVTIENDEEKPVFEPINTANYDKEFTVTEESTIERIYSAFGQENWYCIRIGKTGFSGDIVADAFAYYNSVVQREQRAIQRILERIVSHWYEPIGESCAIELLTFNNKTSNGTLN